MVSSGVHLQCIRRQLFVQLIIISISQSDLVHCDEIPDQQYFKVRPQSVQLVEGQTTELQCHIGNLGGQVQWSKDGFVLGYESIIPGFPRYQMVIDEPRGIYNLRLNHVTLDDEAEYQCQFRQNRLSSAIALVMIAELLKHVRASKRHSAVGFETLNPQLTSGGIGIINPSTKVNKL
ncbi:nephrin-like, partial [Tropilaelaps mercedesae]